MSAQKKSILTLTLAATAVLTKYNPVTIAGAIAAAGTAAIGFVTEDAAIGDNIAVDVLGTTIAIPSAGITAGVAVEVAASGKVVTATTGVPIGIALHTGVADQPFEILLTPGLSAPA